MYFIDWNYSPMTETCPPNKFTSELIVKRIGDNKSDYMQLLLIGDESEKMVNHYIDIGNLFVGFVDGKAVSCIVTINIADETVEVKNLAVIPNFRKKGIGRRMLAYVERLYPGCKIFIGTGETPSTLRFYQSCGYHYSHRIADFFTDNYSNQIVEEGITLKDMIYLYKHS